MSSSGDAPYTFSAPLPSPTSNAPQHFHFPTSSSQHPFQASGMQHLGGQFSTPQQHSNQNPQKSSNTQQQPQQQHTQQSGVSGQAQNLVMPSNDPSSPLRRDFGLLAEAAKRAQLAVITRDLGEVDL